jgi:hypothetical protein
MKEFRGTILSFALFGVLFLGYTFVAEEENEVVEDRKIFSFEKHDVQKAKIERPDGLELTLAEKDGEWIILETGHPASITMVNRIRHQLHDLEARAQVNASSSDLELYGLGEKAIKVELQLKDGTGLSFLAGDPNPTGVSYYIKPIPGDEIYTVKKSAVDYYSADYDSFRNPRFLHMDTKSVQQLQVKKKDGEEWNFNRIDEHRWEVTNPIEMRASTTSLRTLIGRCIALKASSFIDPEDVTTLDYGLAEPLLHLQFTLDTGEAIELKIGQEAIDEGHSYFQLKENPVIFVAKNGLLEEFEFSKEKFINRRVIDVDSSEVTSVTVVSHENDTAGTASMTFRAGEWFWSTGTPVSGSTPRRLASALDHLEVVEFEEDTKLGQVILEIQVESAAGTRHILFGDSGPPQSLIDGREYPRRYMSLKGEEVTFLVDEHLLSIGRDAVREFKRNQK